MSEPIQAQPFETDDGALAITLHMCGVPHPSVSPEDRRIVPCMNLYSRDMLRKHGFAGVPIKTAVAALFKKGVPGSVRYLFERGPVLDAVLAAWSAAKRDMEAAPADVEHPIGEPMDAAQVAQVCALFARTRKQFYGDGKGQVPLWKKVLPCYLSEGETRTSTDPQTRQRVTFGSLKMESVQV